MVVVKLKVSNSAEAAGVGGEVAVHTEAARHVQTHRLGKKQGAALSEKRTWAIVPLFDKE